MATKKTTGGRGFVLGMAAFGLSVFAIVAGVTYYVSSNTGSRTATQASSVGGPFSLVDQNGATVTEADLKGKATLVFFGFTHCPDVCPTALYEITQTLASLGQDAAKTQVLFVTVDPERDTKDAMKSYLSSFAPQIRGLTGDQAAVDGMVKAYRAYAKRQPLKDGGYTMDHTALVYLMDKNGAFVAPLNIKRKPEDIAADVRPYV